VVTSAKKIGEGSFLDTDASSLDDETISTSAARHVPTRQL
jgi:hypothetical protein